VRPAAEALAPARVEPITLAARDVTVRFGGLVAVDKASIDVPSGRITGLIGPNGAGKTTLLNVCTGQIKPTSGKILLDDRDISRFTPAARARSGVSRTFQQMELFENLSVRDNVVLGREGCLAGANVLTQIIPKPGDRHIVDVSVADAIDRCGLNELVDLQVASLSTGQRRLVELARCLASPAQILLLDEPSAGLDARETEHVAEIMRSFVAEKGVGVLLVEHDMSLVMSVCDEIYVLDYGEPIFRGTPEETRSSEKVKAAYLGSDTGEDEGAQPQEVGALGEERSGTLR
jgi:ABC-type branched-subunit amino acid transport system ATPase component